MKIIINPSAPATVQKCVGIIPGVFDTEGIMMHDARNTIKAFALPDHNVVVAKRFGRPSWLQRLGRIGRATKGEYAYTNSLRLTEHSVSTPMPYAYIEANRCEFYYICANDGGLPLVDMLETDENAQALAEFFASLHKRGILHKDLNNTNIRYRIDRKTGQPHFSLIDTNRMRFYSTMPPQKKCIANTYRFSGCTPFFINFLERYLSIMGWDGPEMLAKCVKKKRAHDARWDHKKAITRPLKKIFRRKK